MRTGLSAALALTLGLLPVAATAAEPAAPPAPACACPARPGHAAGAACPAGQACPGMQGHGKMMHGSGGWGPQGAYQRLYDPARAVKVEGKIVEKKAPEVQQGMLPASALVVESKGKRTEVHLGPSWYVDRQDVELAVGDTVTIDGVTAEHGGKSFVIARSVTRGGDQLVLRDELGRAAGGGVRGGGGRGPRAPGPAATGSSPW